MSSGAYAGFFGSKGGGSDISSLWPFIIRFFLYVYLSKPGQY